MVTFLSQELPCLAGFLHSWTWRSAFTERVAISQNQPKVGWRDISTLYKLFSSNIHGKKPWKLKPSQRVTQKGKVPRDVSQFPDVSLYLIIPSFSQRPMKASSLVSTPPPPIRKFLTNFLLVFFFFNSVNHSTLAFAKILLKIFFGLDIAWLLMARGGFWSYGQWWWWALWCQFSLSIMESCSWFPPSYRRSTMDICQGEHHFFCFGSHHSKLIGEKDCLTWH